MFVNFIHQKVWILNIWIQLFNLGFEKSLFDDFLKPFIEKLTIVDNEEQWLVVCKTHFSTDSL